MADEPVDRPAPRLAHASAVPVLLSLILLVALWLRLFGPSGHAFDWGDGQFVHPDEGFVGGTLIHNLTFPTGIGDLFNADSGWNPAVAASLPQLTPTGHPVHGSNGFNYGSLPLYLVKIFAALLSWLGGICPWWAGWKGIDQSPILAGRVLSALFDTATVFLVYQIGSRLAGRWTGLYAAALACVAVLPIQLAHFTTVDTILTTFATGTVLASIDLLTHGSRRHYAIAGIWLAAALATKVSAVPLVALVALAHLWRVGRDARVDPWQALLSPRYLWERALRRGLLAPASLAAMLTATVATGAALFLFQPYTFSDWSTFWSGVSYQSDLASGRQLIFYTLKWHGTAPIVYPLEQLSRYSLGLPLAALAYAGVAYAALRMLTPWRNAAFLVAFFAVSYFAANGLLYMKYLRYMAPIVPSLCVLAALLVSALVRRPSPSLLRLFGYGCGALVLALTGGYAAAYQHIYAVPLTRLQATCWMAANLPNGSTLAQDAPDEPQPLPACGATAKGFRSVGMPTLLLYEDDSQAKAAQMGAVLAQAQYYIISSRRAIETFWDYGSKYPYTQRFYRSLLGSGKQVQDPLGFTQVASFAEHPQLGRWVFQDYAANQNFNEYDHPPVWIFANTGHLSADALTAVLTDHGRIPDPSLAVPAMATPPKPLLLSAAQLAANAKTPTYARMFPPDSLPMRQPALVWLLMVEALGLLTLPFGMRLFGRLADRGFVLAKTAGILLLSWFAWILPSIGLAAYSRSEIVLCLLPVAALSLGWGVKLREVPGLLRARLAPVLLTEAVFLLGFGAWVWVRMLYPDLWHPFDGGEKTMDFSFLNAIVRSRAMPPLDPWFSGGHLNYYYYGHFTVATLLKLAGIAPATAVNLAIPTFFALALASCVSIGYTLARRAGVAMLAAAMAMLGGNLYGAEQLIADLQALSPERPTLHPAVAAGSDIPLLGGIIGMLSYAWSLLDGVFRGAETVLSGLAQVALHHATPPAYPFRNWAWAGSRVIDNHQIITEFPFFTFLYGDPHAHLWDIPFVLCVIGLALNLALAERPGTHNRRSAVPASPSLALLPGGGLLVWPAMGVLLGAVGPTNPWDLATMVAILALALAARSFRQDADWPRTLLSVGTRLVVLIGCALLFYAPFYLHFQSFYSHLGWTLLRHQTPLGDFLTQFGLPIFVLGSYLVHGVLARTRTGASLRARARALEFTLYYWERRSLLPRYFALVRRRRPRMPSSWRGYQHRPRQALTIAVLGLLVIGAAATLKLWLLVALLVVVVYALLVAGPVPALLLVGGGLIAAVPGDRLPGAGAAERAADHDPAADARPEGGGDKGRRAGGTAGRGGAVPPCADRRRPARRGGRRDRLRAGLLRSRPAAVPQQHDLQALRGHMAAPQPRGRRGPDPAGRAAAAPAVWIRISPNGPIRDAPRFTPIARAGHTRLGLALAVRHGPAAARRGYLPDPDAARATRPAGHGLARPGQGEHPTHAGRLGLPALRLSGRVPGHRLDPDACGGHPGDPAEPLRGLRELLGQGHHVHRHAVRGQLGLRSRPAALQPAGRRRGAPLPRAGGTARARRGGHYL